MRWIIRVVTWDISTVFIPSRVGRLPHRENAQSSGRDATIPINISAQPAAQYVNNVLKCRQPLEPQSPTAPLNREMVCPRVMLHIYSMSMPAREHVLFSAEEMLFGSW